MVPASKNVKAMGLCLRIDDTVVSIPVREGIARKPSGKAAMARNTQIGQMQVDGTVADTFVRQPSGGGLNRFIDGYVNIGGAPDSFPSAQSSDVIHRRLRNLHCQFVSHQGQNCDPTTVQRLKGGKIASGRRVAEKVGIRAMIPFSVTAAPRRPPPKR